jgi:hypothetical protein
MITYPRSIIPILMQKWKSLGRRKYGRPSALPTLPELELLIDIAFHATFLTDEGRRTGFRIIYYSPDEYEKELKEDSQSNIYIGDHRLIRMDEPRPYNISEVGRLAPAAEFTRFMLCVANFSKDKEKPDLYVWGMLDVGENWWKFIHHESSSGKPPPNYLTITSSNPGEFAFSIQGKIILTLKSGQIVYPTNNALWGGPIADFFKDAKQQLYKEVTKELNTPSFDADGHDNDYPSNFYDFFLERILFNIRQKHHGGTIIFVPSNLKKSDTRLNDRINIKYPCLYDDAWGLLVKNLVNFRKFYDVHFPLWDGKIKLTKDRFQNYFMLSEEDEELDEAISDVTQAIASLSSVDGAVIMNDKLVVMGFGVEVTAISPTLKEIIIVTQPTNRSVDIQSYGTRHRSAFRFCSTFEQSVVFVVSSDGGVKAVKRDGSDVFLWPDINTGSMGL